MIPAPPRLWIPFGEYAPELDACLGGKASSLHRMTAWGLPVPAGFTVPAEAYRAWVAASDLGGAVETVLDALARGAPANEVDAAAAELRARGVAAELPVPVRRALAAGIRSLGPVEALAIRSSGNLEDGAEASFAGLYETFLDVGSGGVEGAVRACWLSLFTTRSLRYMQRNQLDPRLLAMAVVVQAMAPGDMAGVCFTVDPVTGREEEALVEVIEGRGDALVSGRVDPHRLRIGITEGEGPGSLGAHTETDLAARLRRDLMPMVRELTAREGRPLDIEFVLDRDQAWLVQSRPVTRIGFAGETGEWTNADFNEGGVSAGGCCQFMWSLYDFIWRNTMPEYLWRIGILEDRQAGGPWAQVFFGVPYWNVGAIKHCLRRVPGFDEVDFDEDLGISKDYQGSPWQTPTTLKTLLGALPVLAFMYREFGRQRASTRTLLKRFLGRERFYLDVDLEGTSDEQVFGLYRRLLLEDYRNVEGTYFMTIFNSSNAKLEFKGAFDALNVGREEPLNYLALMSGMRGLRTLAAVHELHRLAGRVVAEPSWRAEIEAPDVAERYRKRGDPGELWRAFDRYLDEFAHHSRRELDPRVPRWGEEPEFVLGLLRQAVASWDPSRDPAVLEKRQHDLYLEERDRARKAFGWNVVSRWWFDRALARSREFCWLREEARDRSTRLYRVIRVYALDVAARLVDRGVLATVDQIFYLPFVDQLRAIDGRLDPAEVQRRAEANQKYLARYRNFRPPRDIGARLKPLEESDDGPTMTGVGGAPGVAKGPARILKDLSESDRVQPGDILVAEFTDPGWTPLLEHVAGVVTEVGGVLSHAAVISREYGVPAVLSVRGATTKLEDGAMVEVDGDRGEVRILDP